MAKHDAFPTTSVNTIPRLFPRMGQHRLGANQPHQRRLCRASSAPDQARQITSARLDDQIGLTWTADNRIVYVADHSDNWDLFITDADGQNSRQLSFDGHYHSNPAVCDSNRSVIFDTDFAGSFHLWKLDLQTAPLPN